MASVKLTKNELKVQKDALKMLSLIHISTSTQKRRPVVSTDGVLRNVIDFIF